MVYTYLPASVIRGVNNIIWDKNVFGRSSVQYFLDAAIDVAEDKQTTMAKEDTNDLKGKTIDASHSRAMKATPGFI